MSESEGTELNILVLGMGSNVSQGIVKALRGIREIPIRIIGACIDKTSIGLYLCDECMLSPRADDPSFIPWYIRVCNEYDIAMSFTGVEENIDALVHNRSIIENGCKTKYAYPDTLIWETGLDKYKTCIWQREHRIPYPDFALASDKKELERLINSTGFPLIAKPRKGKSSLGIMFANDRDGLEPIINREGYIIQECIGNIDEEYTVGCYYDKSGKLRASVAMRRYLKNGTTSMTEVVDDERIDRLIHDISKNLRTTGPINFQMRISDQGVPTVFEWNVRFSGSTAIRNHFGFCDVEAAVREYVLGEGIGVCFSNQRTGVALRMDEEVYFEQETFEGLFGRLDNVQ